MARCLCWLFIVSMSQVWQWTIHNRVWGKKQNQKQPEHKMFCYKDLKASNLIGAQHNRKMHLYFACILLHSQMFNCMNDVKIHCQLNWPPNKQQNVSCGSCPASSDFQKTTVHFNMKSGNCPFLGNTSKAMYVKIYYVKKMKTWYPKGCCHWSHMDTLKMEEEALICHVYIRA